MFRLIRSWVLPGVVLIAATGGGSAMASVMPAGTGAGLTHPAVRICGEGPAVVRPASMILTCADRGEQAKKLHWTSWTPAEATATGTVTWRDCTEMCADSKRWAATGADYTLTDPEHVAGRGVLFTRLDMHVTGATPPGFMRNLAFDEAPVAIPASPAQPRTGRAVRPRTRWAPSGTLGYAQIEGYWLYAGGPNGGAGDYDQAQVAAAITGAESTFYPGNIQPYEDYCSGSSVAGWGLWQITCGNSVSQYGTDFQLLDPWNNAEAAVYKCKGDEGRGYNCFSPWSTWASGAYLQFLQHTGADMSISDPGEYVQYHSTPPGTPSSPGPHPGSTFGPPMPNSSPSLYPSGGPAVYDPLDKALEVYGAGRNGRLEEDWWTKADGWLATGLPGTPSAVTGSPSAVYDPLAKHLEVYAVGSDGRMQEAWWFPSKWETSELPVTPSPVTGSPSVVYDPLDNAIEVYARGRDGRLEEDWWTKADGWLATELPGTPSAVTGSPSAVYDPVAKHVEVYAAGSDGQVQEAWWFPSKWETSELPATPSAVTGSPSAVYDPLDNAIEVYGTGSDGLLQEDWWTKDSIWRATELPGTPSAVTGSPSAVYDPLAKHLEVYATGSDGRMQEAWWFPSKWDTTEVPGTPSAVTGGPAAVYDQVASHLEVYAAGSNGQVQEAWWFPSKWDTGQLPVTPSPVTAAVTGHR